MPGPANPLAGSKSPIDSLVQQNYGTYGTEVAIFKNGSLLFAHGYGLRDRGLPDRFPNHPSFWGVPQPDVGLNLTRGAFAPDENTEFELASVSKEFTAGAILLLQQDGKLSVNDLLSKYFPTLPGGNTITLQLLLQHRSGFVDYNNFGSAPDFSAAYSQFMSGGQTNYQPIVDALATFPLQFTPGTQYSYSNTNYVLLAIIVASVSGMTFGDFLQQRIFGPLGMTQTHQGLPPASDDFALGYGDVGSGPIRLYQWNLTWLAGPGGLTSTVGDLEKWDRAVGQPGIFTQASLTQMFTPSPIAASYGSYADGWIIATLNGRRFIWHDGAIGGYQSVNATFPDDGIDIIVLTNDDAGPDPYFIIPQLFADAQALATNRTPLRLR